MEQSITLPKQFKNTVISDLQSLEGTEFEFFCRYFMELIVDADLLHKGCDLNGKAVGYAVDIKSEDCAIVGQSGTDKDYFTNSSLKKPISDIEGTMKNNKLCEHLYLLSNQRDTDREHTALYSKISTLGLPFKVHVYDVEKIADTIYENINHPKIGNLWKYIPNAYQHYAILPKKNSLPLSSSRYVDRSDDLDVLKKLLKTNNIVQIYGISGIGKSEFAKEIAKDISQNYESVYWFNGEDYMGNIESVHLSQFGYDINLNFAITFHKVLVIADNFNEEVNKFYDQFAQSNKKGSTCIITSLQRSLQASESFDLPFLNKNQSELIIKSYGINLSQEEQDGILSLLDGYPLALNIVCSLIKEGTLTANDVLTDEVLRDIEDDKHQKVTNRIIEKIYTRYADELDLLAYIDSLIISNDFIKLMFGKLKFQYLNDSSVIQYNDPYTIRIHQVVFNAIKSVSKEPSDLKNTADTLVKYLVKENSIKDVNFFVFYRYNESFIKKIYSLDFVSTKQKKVMLYSALQYHDTFADPTKYIKLIDSFTLSPDSDLYDCLINNEKVEIELSQYKDEENSKRITIERISYLENILNRASDKSIRIELMHHIGKLYEKIKDYDKAEGYFNEALKLCPDKPETLLQLAKVQHYRKPQKLNEAKDIITTILNNYLSKKDVPLTVLLDCYALFLSKYQYSDLEDKYIESDFLRFESELTESLNSFKTQAINTLGKFAYNFSYSKPEFLRKILNMLSEPPADNMGKKSLQAFAYLKSTEYSLEEDKSSEKSKEIFEAANRYFKLIGPENDYDRKRYMELAMEAGMLDLATEISKTFEDMENEFNLQDIAKLHSAKGNYRLAIETIDKAISKAKYKTFKSSFLSNKAYFLHDAGDKSCMKVLEDAISIRKEDKAKEEWKKTLENWKNEFKEK